MRSRVVQSSAPLTINTLEATARRGVDVIAIGTKQLHCVEAWQVRPAAWYDVTPAAVYTRATPEYPLFIFLNLANRYERHIHGNNQQHRGLTIACSPARVKMNLWCTKPYRSSADASTMETSGIFEVSSSWPKRTEIRSSNEETRM